MIEMMIGISIFLFVVVFGITSLLNAFFLNQRSQGVRSVIDSLSYAVDDMARNIRVGYSYRCFSKSESVITEADLAIPTSCRNGFGIAFESSLGDPANPSDQWVYYFQNGKLFRSVSGMSGSIQMTPEEVTIDTNASNFSVLGAESSAEGDSQQPLVTIKLSGTITEASGVVPFALQTSISQRVNDE